MAEPATVTIPLDQIEPYLCTSTKAVRRYETMFRAGEKVPPILVERSTAGGRQAVLVPFQIYNGAHRLQAAHLAGVTTIEAFIVENPKGMHPEIPDAYMGLFDR